MSEYRPDRRTFEELASRYPVVPVWRTVVADTQTPVSAYLRLAGPNQANAFLLESVEGGERWARYSFLGGDTFGVVNAFGRRVEVQGSLPVQPDEGEPPLAFVSRLLGELRGPEIEGVPPMHGGAVGFIGYDAVRELENLPQAPPDDLGLPDISLLLTRTMVVFDHFAQQARVFANVPSTSDPRGAYDEAVASCEAVIDALAAPLPAATVDLELGRMPDFDSNVDDSEFASWVGRAREHIFAGDVFQVVLSRRFEMPLVGSSFPAYRALRTVNPSPYMYHLRFAPGDSHPAFEISGSSPEPMVRVAGDEILSRPIAGTRRRGATPEEDAQLAEELLNDEKERAEHVMLVDLARNDVGRISAYGAVKVEDLMTIERYSHVMHIVSSVTGRLDDRHSPFDAFTACFPAGTVSGAPKVRAMELIDSMEKTRRGPYAGAVGYFDLSGNLDTCITIRTIVATAGKAYVQAGAGIVADSDPDAEADETRRKAEALLRAVAAGAALASSSQGS
ncbi:MAG TPA: anthranilate synthase component I [Actinomycetota bacterium]|nr:anthranilate synthase component I [Actinomycetota bacterium]